MERYVVKTGFSTGFLRPDSMEKVLKTCAESGIRLVELWEHDGFFAENTDPEAVQGCLASHDISVNSVHAPFPDGALLGLDRHIRYLSLFERVCRKAAVYGASYVVFHPAVVEGELFPEDGDLMRAMPRSVSLWKRLAATASDQGLRLAFENLPCCLAWPEGLSPMRIAGMIQSAEMENTGICLDVSHCFAIDIAHLLYDVLPDLNPIGVHLSDGIYHNRKDRHLPPGEGDFDWEEFLRILLLHHASAALIIEVNTPYLDGALLGKISEFLSEKERLVPEGFARSASGGFSEE
jgi:sugar phosphate isomerase/epimerase